MQKASKAERKCLSYWLCYTKNHNYKRQSTRPTSHHKSGLKVLPKVFWRCNSCKGLVIASDMLFWTGALPYPNRNSIKMSLFWDGNKPSLLTSFWSSVFLTCIFAIYWNSKYIYGSIILGWKIQSLSSWDSWLTSNRRDRYTNNVICFRINVKCGDNFFCCGWSCEGYCVKLTL